jgi:hypothetical protein
MLNYGTKFAGLGTGVFPTFAAKNASGPTATDGFPYTADSVNDWIGFTQALLNKAGLVPSGQLEVNGASQLIEALMRGAGRTPGDIGYTAIPTQAQRAARRMLDLTGQIISITGAYADLAANVYCGDGNNASAPAFYKCDASGNRTTSGAYMKLPDCRGIFLRAEGSQVRTVTWTDSSGAVHTVNTLYDGKSIGEVITDAIRDITGNIVGGSNGVAMINADGTLTGSGALIISASLSSFQLNAGTWIGEARRFAIASSYAVPMANENRPGSVSVSVYISY